MLKKSFSQTKSEKYTPFLLPAIHLPPFDNWLLPIQSWLVSDVSDLSFLLGRKSLLEFFDQICLLVIYKYIKIDYRKYQGRSSVLYMIRKYMIYSI